jgi:NADH-quinone oxidoreductase subunit C
MSHSIQTLEAALHDVLGSKVKLLESALGELTLTVSAVDYHDVCKTLRDDSRLGFEQLMDLCGLDYSSYKDGAHSKFTDGPRYAVVSHLLSVSHNWRLRVRVFAVSEDVPVVASVNDLWNSANWFEREAFDLFGIVFEGHLDLRRLLTDYGFVGHPFRKDFPTSGHHG